MITAVDTSVLLDVFGADPSFGVRSRESLRACLAQGAAIACEIVWAEVAAGLPETSSAVDALSRLGIGFDPTDASTAVAAGAAFGDYRRAGGARERLIPDFLIGAHARACSDRLLTRDRGFFRRHFGDLTIVDPLAAE